MDIVISVLLNSNYYFSVVSFYIYMFSLFSSSFNCFKIDLNFIFLF